MDEYFELGRILKPQGVKGELKAELYTDDIERVHSLPYVFVGSPSSPDKRKVLNARSDGRFAYLTLEGVSDRSTAEEMRSIPLFIDRENAAPIPEGSFYIQDLLGLVVSTDEGDVLGTLKDILQTGAADVYVVAREDGSELLFPAADGIFVRRAPAEGSIVVSAARLAEVAEI